MKAETLVITLKATCATLAGIAGSLVTSLAQWAATGEWPPRVCWVAIIAGAVAAGAQQLGSFLSNAFANYKASMDSGTGAGTPTNTK